MNWVARTATLALVCGLARSATADPARVMAITVDDLPVVSSVYRDVAAQKLITDQLLATLTAHRVPAIGFVNEEKLYDDDAVDARRAKLLAQWLEAGMELGNHTFSHPDLHRVGLEDFLAEIDRGERVTRRLVQKHGSTLRYFRHPFLHTGLDLATRDAVVAYLSTRAYRVAPVTIDNADYVFARAYELALSSDQSELAGRIAVDYVHYMEAMAAYYEDQSRQLFDREIPQVLLIHANKLNADHLDALLDRYVARGYSFASLGDVLKDVAYQSEDRFTGRGGITWLHRWAITAQKDASMFAGEPEPPEYVTEAAELGR